MKKKLLFILTILIISCIPLYVYSIDNTKEDFANIVFFAYFEGTEAEEAADKEYFNTRSSDLISYYEGSSNRSLKNYLKAISFDKFEVHNIFPQYKDGKLEPVKLNLDIKRAYETPYDVTIINEVIKNYPDIGNYTIDYNNDGFIDNVTIIIKSRSGYTAGSESSFTSHKAEYPAGKDYLGKKLFTYNIIGTDSITGKYQYDGSEAGVIAHEFLHSVGFSDLYTKDGTHPVFVWDIMASANRGMPYPLAYTRLYFKNWVNIPEITTSQTNIKVYQPNNKDKNIAYILKSPINENEIFVVEYRKKTTTYDDTLDGNIPVYDGIIVYRVNKNVTKISNYHGQTGIYVFRPIKGYESETENTRIYNAALSSNNNRTSIGNSDFGASLIDGALTFSDGTNSGIVISNVSASGGDYMTFDVTFPDTTTMDLWKNTNIPYSIERTDSKNITLINKNNKLYTLLAADTKLYTYILENDNWVLKNTSNIYSRFSQFKSVNINDDLYVGISSTNSFDLYKWNNNSWTKVGSLNKTINSDFDLEVINNQIYLTAISNGEAKLYRFDSNTFTDLGTFINDNMVGLPRIASVDTTIYVSFKKGNSFKLFKYTNNSFTEINKSFDINSYDMKQFNNELYIMYTKVGTEDDFKVVRYDGNNFTEITPPIKLREPNMITSQGNLYIVGTQNNNLYLLAYDESNNTLKIEGGKIDSSGVSYGTSAASIDNTIYVGYDKRYDNTSNNDIFVKSKTTVNSLLFITVNPPNKIDYKVGETLDKTGLKVYANYTLNNKEITNYKITGFDTSTPGEKEATITFEGLTDKFTYYVTNEDIPLTSISLNKLSENLFVNDTSTLKVTYNPTNTTDDKTVTWSSTDTRIATVTNGVVKAISPGTTTIKAKVGEKYAIYTLTVKEKIPLNSISLDKTNITLNIGSTTNLNVSYNPTNTTDNKNITWSTSNNNVVSVIGGKLYANNAGTATIKAKVGNKEASCTVTVPRINISGASTSIGNQVYTGNYIDVDPQIYLNGVLLRRNIDYTLSYSNNVNIGTATVTVNGINNYVGSKSFNYNIVFGSPYLFAESQTTSSIKLRWTPVAGATNYKVYRYNAKKRKYVLVKTLKANQTYLNIKKLSRATNYNFYVLAYNNVHQSQSNVLITSTKTSKPYIRRLTTKNSSITINWNRIARSSGYVVYRSTSKKGYYEPIAYIWNPKTTKYIDYNLNRNQNYYYRVEAIRVVNDQVIYSGRSNYKYKKCK